jgi:hypothetical protein
MRTHIYGDIFISGGLGYNIEKKVVRNVKDKKTGVVSQQEFFDIEKHYVTLGGAINGLLHHKISSIPDEQVLELQELVALVENHKQFIESKLGGIKA